MIFLLSFPLSLSAFHGLHSARALLLFSQLVPPGFRSILRKLANLCAQLCRAQPKPLKVRLNCIFQKLLFGYPRLFRIPLQFPVKLLGQATPKRNAALTRLGHLFSFCYDVLTSRHVSINDRLVAKNSCSGTARVFLSVELDPLIAWFPVSLTIVLLTVTTIS